MSINVTIIEARKLRDADRGLLRKSDPYVVVRSGNQTFKTSTKKNTLSPTWNETFQLQPSNEGVRFEVFDYDKIGSNDSLGQAVLHVHSLPPGQTFDQWIKLTGKGSGKGELHVKLINHAPQMQQQFQPQMQQQFQPPMQQQYQPPMQQYHQPQQSYHQPQQSLAPLHRYYNHGIKDHHYTVGQNELGSGNNGYQHEGIVGYVSTQQIPNTKPVYRLFHHTANDHFFTSDSNEANTCRSKHGQYNDEGISGYVWQQPGPGLVPLHRLYHSGTADHLYTAGQNEVNTIQGQGWVKEGILGYIKTHP